MKTHDELYNAIRTRLNTLIPARLELRFGCEVHFYSEPLGHVNEIVKTNDDDEVCHDVLCFNAGDFEEKGMPTRLDTGFLDEEHGWALYGKILGTPPTMQEILLAIGKDLDFVDTRHKKAGMIFFRRHFGFEKEPTNAVHYNLKKSVKDQETSTLQAIYDLLV